MFKLELTYRDKPMATYISRKRESLEKFLRMQSDHTCAFISEINLTNTGVDWAESVLVSGDLVARQR